MNLTHNNDRIGVLPQIYYPYMAIQWANIDRVSGGSLDFVGSLTQPSAPGSLRPPQGWAALRNALATLHTTPVLPNAIDLVRAEGDGLVGARAVA